MLKLLDRETATEETVVELPSVHWFNLSVSADDQWALYSQYDDSGSDLMLVENFR